MKSREKDYTALVVIYNEVFVFPPTANAIHLLAKKFGRVEVLEVINENHIDEEYPVNVIFHTIQRRSDSTRSRFKTFLEFSKTFNRLRQSLRPQLILLYDPVAAMTGWLSLRTMRKKEVWWYHNHDIIEKTTLRPFSLLFFAGSLERRLLTSLDIFTIPSAERIEVYNLEQIKGIRRVIPNYPSFHFYQNVTLPEKSNTEITLIYQGTISEGHGFEDIMKLLPLRINNRTIKLCLIGFSNLVYVSTLRKIIEARHLQEYVTILDKVKYEQLPFITRKCHLGIAIYTGTDIMNSTLGTASNKIYEYTAIGLPFLYFQNDHFHQYLGDMPWAIPTDLSESSLKEAIQKADDQFDHLSVLARKEFEERRNYEQVFTPVIEDAIALVHQKENGN